MAAGSGGFDPFQRKTRVARKGGQQRVTGLVVNRILNVPRDDVRRLRAAFDRIRW